MRHSDSSDDRAATPSPWAAITTLHRVVLKRLIAGDRGLAGLSPILPTPRPRRRRRPGAAVIATANCSNPRLRVHRTDAPDPRRQEWDHEPQFENPVAALRAADDR